MRTIQYGSEHMTLHDDGTISRPAISMKASGQWRVTHAVTLNNFGRPVRRYALADIINAPDSIPWKHKNGKQRTHICDLDHGTRRLWGNPTHSVF